LTKQYGNYKTYEIKLDLAGIEEVLPSGKCPIQVKKGKYFFYFKVLKKTIDGEFKIKYPCFPIWSLSMMKIIAIVLLSKSPTYYIGMGLILK
jgi:hypothetical protein